MRMWMVNPKLLCNKHLLGEHGEIHKFRHIFEKGHVIMGRLFPIVQIQPNSMEKRHNELAKEMLARGMKHESPYSQPSLEHYGPKLINAKVNKQQSILDLCSRCEDCKTRISNYLK